ncbi:hypothetical protein BJ165DRAFT_1317218, partial [Panaeolus papilionaceus]
KLPHPIAIYNTDGSHNTSRSIRYCCTIQVTLEDHTEDITCSVTNIGTSPVILGYSWLRRRNPLVDWRTGKL